MTWPVSFGFEAFWSRKDKNPPRAHFQFKSRAEVKAMSFRERKLYFEGLLAELYALQDEFGELERERLAEVARRQFLGAASTANPVPVIKTPPVSGDLWNNDVH